MIRFLIKYLSEEQEQEEEESERERKHKFSYFVTFFFNHLMSNSISFGGLLPADAGNLGRFLSRRAAPSVRSSPRPPVVLAPVQAFL